MYAPYTGAVIVPNTTNISNAAAAQCTPAGLFDFHTALQEWNACQACGRQGFGSIKNADGTYSCDTTQQKAGALASCAPGPVNPCYPFVRPLSADNPWEQMEPHAWGSSVFDPTYGKPNSY